MRVLFIASNPDTQQTLTLEREITDLQRRIGLSSGDEVVFKFLPALPIEELTSSVMKFQPTIVHLSAHGDDKALQLANADRQKVEITGPVLAALLDVSSPPSLVYINACKSARVAEEVTRVIPMAIGTTAAITNRAARASALLFYERLLNGATVAQSFRSSTALLKAMENGGAQSVLFPKAGGLPAQTRLVDVPRIVAQFPIERGAKRISIDCENDGDGYCLDIGVAGCPPDTTQVVFFTDDDTMADPDEDWADEAGLEEDEARAANYAKIVKGPPVRGKIWSESWWRPEGDFRVFATGVTGSGKSFSAYAMVCDALEAGLKAGDYKGSTATQRDAMVAAIADLRANDGA